MEPAALTRSSSLTRFPSRCGLANLRLARVNSSFSILPPKTLLLRKSLPLRISASLSLPRHSIRLRAVEDHHHDHHHDGEQDHHRHHHQQHGCGSEELKVHSEPQKVLFGFARAIGWVRLANFLREHLHLYCSSAAMFLAAAACPYLVPTPYIKPLQNAFMIVGFPLVWTSLDALMDIAGGKVNIHVLMVLAAFASVFMGNALEGGLLLAMFNLAHFGGTLLVCLNSVRGLNDPSWSWKQDLAHLINWLSSRESSSSNSLNSTEPAH